MNATFHEGERALQALAEETAMAQRNAAMRTQSVIAGARPFIARQGMAVLGSVGADGAVWASMLFGKPGFAQATDGGTIAFALPLEERDRADPLWANLEANPELGMLFIELGTRKRYRVNGSVRRLDARGVEVAIREAYPNCPRYIQRREPRQAGAPRPPLPALHGTLLDGAAEGIVRRADTLFVASRHAASGADASHRGGPPGFAKLVDATTLRIPDYAGNSLFNTLGNIKVDGRAGVCIPDFEHGRLLQLSGRATVLLDQDDPANETGGTGRYWECRVERWILRDMPPSMAWDYLDASPFLPPLR